MLCDLCVLCGSKNKAAVYTIVKFWIAALRDTLLAMTKSNNMLEALKSIPASDAKHLLRICTNGLTIVVRVKMD